MAAKSIRSEIDAVLGREIAVCRAAAAQRAATAPTHGSWNATTTSQERPARERTKRQTVDQDRLVLLDSSSNSPIGSSIKGFGQAGHLHLRVDMSSFLMA
jgi:hypothetical protein